MIGLGFFILKSAKSVSNNNILFWYFSTYFVQYFHGLVDSLFSGLIFVFVRNTKYSDATFPGILFKIIEFGEG